VTTPRRPRGWIAPGPPPAGPGDRAELVPAADEDLAYLAGDWRLFQKRSGHRWSLDDLITAWVATRDRDPTIAVRALDLGCGLGSVLLLVAWRLPAATVLGIEAQADRAALGRRSIAYNGVAERCQIVDGDLREMTAAAGTTFDLITGTPPYFPRGTGTESAKPHAAPCRFELRGGVEDYLAAAAGRLAPRGTITMCTSSLERARVTAGAAAAGLTVREHWEIVPRTGKAALIAVDQLTTEPGPRRDHQLIVRDAAGAWTSDFRTVRRDLGMPDRPPAHAPEPP
jgi:tRNA1Val (adenine37-N6)-methyltransferase